MRVVHLKCPNCAASLDAPGSAQSIQCTYCNTTCRIQHRTGFFDRPAPLRPPSSIELSMPVATVGHALSRIIIGLMIVPIVIVGVYLIITFGINRSGSDAEEMADSRAQKRAESWTYSGFGNPILSDVNSDGVIDIVGHIRKVLNNDSNHVAAFSGVDGSIIWQTERFGGHSDTVSGILAIHGSTLMQSDTHGNITAYQLESGTTLWTASMGEKLSALCSQSETSLALHLNDQSWLSLEIATGAVSKLANKPDKCAPVIKAGENSQANLEYSDGSSRDRHKNVPGKIEGMQIKTSARFKDGSAIGLGYKAPGTKTPMIAIFTPTDKTLELLWSAQLPGNDPLSASPEAPEFVAANQTQVCSLYEISKKPAHVVCFDRTSGKRLWDKAMPTSGGMVIAAIDATDKIVLISQWTSLDAFDAKSGKHLFSTKK